MHVEDWMAEFSPTERDIKLRELVMRYHAECEAYDRTVCTGPERFGMVWPATYREIKLITWHAQAARRQIMADARAEGFTDADVLVAINRWREFHNAR